MGARFLQWPHHGAKNSTSAGLLDSKTTLSKFEGMRSRTEDAAETRGMTSVRKDTSRTMAAVVNEMKTVRTNAWKGKQQQEFKGYAKLALLTSGSSGDCRQKR